MPSTPRMKAIEAKASQPGEPLTQADISLWHREHVGERPLVLVDFCSDPIPRRLPPLSRASWADGACMPEMTSEYPKAIRYLDSTGYRRPMNESL